MWLRGVLLLRGCFVQLEVVASDGGTPARSSTATVDVTVRRNLHKPQFAPNRYEADLLETQALGEPLLRVTAIDADVVVSCYTVQITCK